METVNLSQAEITFLIDSIEEIKELYLEDDTIELYEHNHNINMVNILSNKLSQIENQNDIP